MVVNNMKLGEVTFTNLSLLIADRFITFPKGIIEDFLIKVDKFIFLVDFIVLYMEEDTKAPLMLGTPFLTIGQALIDVKNVELTLRVGEEEVKLKLHENMKFHG